MTDHERKAVAASVPDLYVFGRTGDAAEIHATPRPPKGDNDSPEPKNADALT
jgi:hypothetical protein